MAGQDLPNQNNLSEFTIWMIIFLSVLILNSIHPVVITLLIIKLMRDKQRLENNKIKLGEDDDEGTITGLINGSPASGLRKCNVKSLHTDMLPEAIVDLPAATVDLPTATVDFPAATVDFPAALPAATVDLPAATVDLPAATVDLSAATVDLPAATVDLPAATVDLSAATVDLPAATVDLPAATVDLPVTIDDLPADIVDLPVPTIDLPVDTISQTFADTRLKPKATADIDIPKDLSFKHPAKTFSHDYHIKYHNIAIFSISYKPPSVMEDDQEEFQPIHHFLDELVLPQPEEEEVMVEDVFTDYGLVEPAEATAHEADTSLIVISPTNTISPSVMMSLVADHSTHCNHDNPTTDLPSNKDD